MCSPSGLKQEPTDDMSYMTPPQKKPRHGMTAFAEAVVRRPAFSATAASSSSAPPTFFPTTTAGASTAGCDVAKEEGDDSEATPADGEEAIKEECVQTPSKLESATADAEDTTPTDAEHIAKPVGPSYNEADEEPPAGPPTGGSDEPGAPPIASPAQ